MTKKYRLVSHHRAVIFFRVESEEWRVKSGEWRVESGDEFRNEFVSS